jgi:hypothetical protein
LAQPASWTLTQQKSTPFSPHLKMPKFPIQYHPKSNEILRVNIKLFLIQVFVTGDFDQWSSSVALEKVWGIEKERSAYHAFCHFFWLLL